MASAKSPKMEEKSAFLDRVVEEQQTIHNKKKKPQSSTDAVPPVFLTPELTSRKYEARNDNEDRLGHHNGQRKLLISEFQLLLDVDPKLKNVRFKHVVYAGAAGGKHIRMLASIFPDYEFHLFDTRPFDEGLKKLKNVELNCQYFDLVTAKYYSDFKGIVFVSDIRTGPSDKCVAENNKLQLECCKIMKPDGALLKFRPPFGVDEYPYAGGKILTPIWGRQSTSETRLMPDINVEKIYTRKYENQMYFINTISRATWWKIGKKEFDLDCCCYDCVCEAMVLKSLNDAERISESVRDFQRKIDCFLGAK